MLKVLHINDYPLDAGGGAEVIMRTSIVLLREHGVSVDTFTGCDLADNRQTPWTYVDNRRARQALQAKLETFRPDVVHLHNYYHVLSPGILATLAEYKRRNPLRVVMTAHDYHLVCPNAGGSWFRWWTGRRETIESLSPTLGSLVTRNWDHRGSLHSLLKLIQHLWSYRWHHRHSVIDMVLCPSRFVEEILAPLRLPTVWLPHPVAWVAPTCGGRDSGQLQLIFAGRIEPEKGLCEFLQNWPADDPARLTIVGTGSELGRCQTICAAKKMTERVEFTGRLPHDQTLARIAAAHVLVQPSRVLETYGLTLIEALASGTNILAGDRGAAREIVADTGVGFLYDLDRPADFARQLQTIRRYFDQGTLNHFDINQFLEDHSEAQYVDRLIQVYQGGVASRLAA